MRLNKRSKIIIFGGLGLIGEYLIHLFIDKGIRDIIVVDRNLSEKDLSYFNLDCLNFIEMNCKKFSISEAGLDSADLIINLIPPNLDVNPIDSLDNQILNYCKINNKSALHLFFGSRKQYGKSNVCLNEDSLCKADSEYGVYKNKLERLYRGFSEYDIDTIFLRISNVYGISNNFFSKKTFINILFKGLKENGKANKKD